MGGKKIKPVTCKQLEDCYLGKLARLPGKYMKGYGKLQRLQTGIPGEYMIIAVCSRFLIYPNEEIEMQGTNSGSVMLVD